MQKTKIAEAPYKAIDWLVAKAEGFIMVMTYGGPHLYVRKVHSFEDDLKWGPTTNPAQAWPIIEREKISTEAYLTGMSGILWKAEIWPDYSKPCTARTEDAPTSLVAAMRCYCAKVYGKEAEVPEELLS